MSQSTFTGRAKQPTVDNISTAISDELLIASLTEEYTKLLREGHAESIDSFLHKHPEVSEPLRECLEGLQLLKRVSSDDRSRVVLAPGDLLGDFRIERELGRGGMGIVYLASQVSLRRRVAIKVLAPRSRLAASELQRFQREAQAVASLEHSHIVPIYQVCKENGFDFFVMRFLDGTGLDVELNEQYRPSLQQLALQFSRIADALNHAHEQGIVHRDVKPSNLILDSDGKLWLTDFGLAATVNHRDMITRSGDIVGTLRYLSPEQTVGKADQVNRRSDVYGLGATMYEFFSGQELFAGYGGLDLLYAIQNKRPASIHHIAASLPADLRTIIERAMRPDPADRFESALELAADLERFSRGEPIMARRVHSMERLAGWSRRNAGGMLILFALSLVSLGAALIHSQLLNREKRNTQMAAERADQHFRQARRSVDSLGNQVAVRLKDLPGADGVRKDLLESMLEYYESFVKESAHESDLSLDVVRTRLEIGRLQFQLGDTEAAELKFREAIAGAELSSISDQSIAPKARVLGAVAANSLAMLLSDQGQHEAAPKLLQKVEGSLASVEQSEPIAAYAVALTKNNLAVLHWRLSDNDLARQLLLESVEALGNVPELDSGSQKAAEVADLGLHSQLADTFNNLAAVAVELNRLEEADAFSQKAIALQHTSTSAANVDLLKLATAHSNRAVMLWKAHDHSTAIDAFRISSEFFEQALKHQPDNVSLSAGLAVTLSNWAMVLFKEEDARSAERLLDRANALMTQAVQTRPNNVSYLHSAAGIHKNLAILHRQQNNSQRASEEFDAANRLALSADQLSKPAQGRSQQ